MEQRTELARRRNVLRIARKGELGLDVERRRGVEIGDIEIQMMDANRRRLFAEVVEINLAVLDAERLDRQVSQRRFLRPPTPLLLLHLRRFTGVGADR